MVFVIHQISETCPSTQRTLDWELCKTIVSTIKEKVKEGMLVDDILLFVKETLLAEDTNAEDLEQPIQQITKSICHAKGITEQQMFENVLSHKISSHMDGVLMPLITAIELSAIQYRETTPLIRLQERVDSTEQEVSETTKDKISIEEERAVGVGVFQEFQSSSQVSSFSPSKDKLITSNTPTIAKKTEVSEICTLTQSKKDWELCETLVSTIEQKVKQGKQVQQILSCVKEDVLADRPIVDLEESIIKITNLICYANNITEKQRFENAQIYTITCHEDAILLPLITAIEFSSVQYIETTSISTVTKRPNETNTTEIEDSGSRKSSIEEGKTLTVQSHQEYSSYEQIVKLEGEKDHLAPSTTVSEIEETQV